MAPLTAPWTMLPLRWGLHSSGARFLTLPRGGTSLRNHLLWSFPRAPRAMDLRSLWRISRRSRHGRLFDLDAARTWWAPDWNGLRGALVGRASRGRRCSVRGSQADSDSRMGCSLQGSPSLVPTAQHGYVSGKSPCTLNHDPHKHPDCPQSPHFHTAKWPKSQNRLFVAQV